MQTPAESDELQRPKRMTRQARMKRTPMAQRSTPMKHGAVTLSAAERAAYEAATERARTLEGYLRCEQCGRSLLDGQEHRHHIIFRSHGGPTEEDNLRVLCRCCHGAVHGIRLC